MSRIYYQLRPSKTREPDVATVIPRSIFMSCHDYACLVMFESDLESRTDITYLARTVYIYNKCHTSVVHSMSPS